MASGNMCRIKRPDTWPHQPPLQKLNMPLANGEPSTQGRLRQAAVGTFPSLLMTSASDGFRQNQTLRI